MIKNRTAQIVFLTMACTLGLLGTVASFGLFNYTLSWDFYIHFTNLSNYLCLGILIAELIQTVRKKEDSYITACPILKFTGMLAILLTFVVFNFILAPSREAHLNFTINSVLLHAVMPVVYIADWFLFYERKQVKWTYPIYSIGFPLAYVIFVYLHAAILRFDTSITLIGVSTPLIYPYFFLNLDTLGVTGVLMWIGMIVAAFVAAGYLFFGLDRLIKSKK